MNNTTPTKPRTVSRRRAIAAVVAAAGVATIGTTIASAAVPTSPTSTTSPFLELAPALPIPRSAADIRHDQIEAVLDQHIKTHGDVLAMVEEATWVRTGQAKHAARIADAARVYRDDPTLDNFDALQSAISDSADARARQAVIAGFHFGHAFQDRPFMEARQWFSAEALALTPADFR